MKKKRCGHVELKKWNNVEFELARKGIRGNRKESVEIFILFAAAFFMIQCIFIMTDSIKSAIQNNRTAQYGAWEYCLPVSEADASIKQNGTCGTLHIIGQLITDGTSESVSIGYYDEQAAQFANLKLLEGSMPQSPNEIAVETEILSMLGLPYKTGERIIASIGVKQTAEDGSISYHYPNEAITLTVSGILSPYSSGWVTAGKVPVPQVIAATGAEQIITSGKLSEDYYLIQLKKSFKKEVLLKYPHLIRNTKAFPDNPYETLDGVLRLLSFSGALISAGVIILTVTKNIRGQKDSISQFALLGAAPGQIRKIILWQCFLYFLTGMPAGLLIGVAAGAGLLKLCSVLTGFSLPISIYPSGIAGSLLLGIGVSLLGSFISVIFSRKLFICERQRCRVKKRKHKQHKKGWKRKKLPAGTMLLRTFSESPARSFLFIFISAIYLASMLMIVDRLKESISLYRYGESLQSDYVLNSVNLTDYQLRELEAVPGVEKVAAVKQDVFFLDPREGAYDAYFQAIKDYQKRWRIDGIEEKEVQVDVTGLSRTSENDEILSKEYGLSDDEMEKFYRGDFICMFLPDLYVGGDPPVALPGIYPGYFSEQLPSVVTEAIKPGRLISLSYSTSGSDSVQRETKELTVGFVTHAYSPEISETNIETGAYGIMMSAGLMDSYDTYPGKGRYQQVLVTANDSATYEATDKAVSAFNNSKVSGAFVNRRILLQERFRQMLTDTASLTFIAIIFTLLLIFILYHLSVYEAERRKERIALLSFLGISNGKLWRIYLAGGIINGLFSTGAGLVLYIGYLARRSILDTVGSFSYTVELRFWQNIQGTSPAAVLFLSIAFLILNLLLHCVPVGKFLCKSKNPGNRVT